MSTTDNWSGSYVNNASFVPKLSNIIVDEYLKPESSDTVLDIGCGDGVLTAKLGSLVRFIHGTDSSANLAEIAKNSHGLSVTVADSRNLDASTLVYPPGESSYSKVFSNAAMHWILCTNGIDDGEKVRQRFFKQVYQALSSGGVFAAEFGGLGNVAEIQAAFIAVLIRHGMSSEDARLVSPWFFPHEDVVKSYLENAGFKVEKIERTYRSTLLPHGNDGMKEWLELFGFAFIEAAKKYGVDRETVLNEVLEIVRIEDYEPVSNQWYAGYVRLRFRAVKE